MNNDPVKLTMLSHTYPQIKVELLVNMEPMTQENTGAVNQAEERVAKQIAHGMALQLLAIEHL